MNILEETFKPGGTTWTEYGTSAQTERERNRMFPGIRLLYGNHGERGVLVRDPAGDEHHETFS